ncbi:MAG: IPT/TIG domain-containing protein [Actinomycetota bacterium]
MNRPRSPEIVNPFKLDVRPFSGSVARRRPSSPRGWSLFVLAVFICVLFADEPPLKAQGADQVGFWEATDHLDSGPCKSANPTMSDSCTFRYDHLSAVLASGEVLVISGSSGATTQLWSPHSKTWKPAATLPFSRFSTNSSLIVLSGPKCGPNCDKILVLGSGPTGQPAGVIYDPENDVWSAAKDPPFPISDPTLTLLAGPRCADKCGKVLVVGGETQPLSLLYDPGTGEWSASGPLINPRFRHTATLLPDGRVLVAGGNNYFTSPAEPGELMRSAEIYDPVEGTWSATDSLTDKRQWHDAILLTGPGCGDNCGKVLLAGGSDELPYRTLRSAQLYNPHSGSGEWEDTGHMLGPRIGLGLIQLPSGKVLAPSTTNPADGSLISPELYDPLEGRWKKTDPSVTESGGGGRSFVSGVPLQEGPVAACADSCGKVLVAGGNGEDAFTSSEIYTPPVEIGGLEPARGSTLGGTEVAIIGTSLARVKTVTFDTTTLTCGKPLQSQCWPDPDTPATKTIAIAPPHAEGKVHVSVTAELQRGETTETHTSPLTRNDLFEYFADPITPLLPSITGISPTCGPEGAPVNIAGAALSGATEVKFGEAGSVPSDRFILASATEISVPSPQFTGSVGIQVVTPSGISSAAADLFASPCASTAIAPTSVPGGTEAGGTNVKTDTQLSPPAPPSTSSTSAGSIQPSAPTLPTGGATSPASFPALHQVPVATPSGTAALQSTLAVPPIEVAAANSAAIPLEVPAPNDKGAARHAMVGRDAAGILVLVFSAAFTMLLGCGLFWRPRNLQDRAAPAYSFAYR